MQVCSYDLCYLTLTTIEEGRGTQGVGGVQGGGGGDSRGVVGVGNLNRNSGTFLQYRSFLGPLPEGGAQHVFQILQELVQENILFLLK